MANMLPNVRLEVNIVDRFSGALCKVDYAIKLAMRNRERWYANRVMEVRAKARGYQAKFTIAPSSETGHPGWAITFFRNEWLCYLLRSKHAKKK